MAAAIRIDIEEVLGDSEIFGALYENELKALVQLGETRRLHTGQTIFQKGDPGDSLMVVLAGRIKIASTSAEGREIILNFIEPGQIFGEIAMLDGKTRTASASAFEAVELFVLRRAPVLDFLEKQPLVAIRLIGVLCAKLRRTTEMLEEKSLLSVAPRIARSLVRLAAEHGEKRKDGIVIAIKLNQTELGGFTGLSRENINRQLRAWREAGIVSQDGGQIVIHDIDALTAFTAELL